MAKKRAEKRIDKKDDELYAFLATFLSIIGFFIVIITRKENKYVMFYAKQSLVVFITMFIAGLLTNIFSPINIVGGIINFALGAFSLVLWIISWLYALSGEMKEVPFVGRFGKKINI